MVTPSDNTTRPKVLCLGVSYPDINAIIQGYRNKANDAVSSSSSSSVNNDVSCNEDDPRIVWTVHDAIQCVTNKLCNQMDGRDLTRIVATENICSVDIYTVSQETGCIQYNNDRHLYANFNRSNFCKKLQQHFTSSSSSSLQQQEEEEGTVNDNTTIQFHQIILDYFWIPTGWDVYHWSTNFFETVLISFVTSKMITASVLPTATIHTNQILYRTGIYLPFCFHCFHMIVAFYKNILTYYYNISFLRKHELQCITLWTGTQTIPPKHMQHILGKRIDQEEVYCTFTERHIKEMECSGTGASKEELISIAMSLEDFHDIRFIVLEPLPILDESHSQYKRGRLLGLTSPYLVQRGFRSDEKEKSLSPTNRPIRSTAPASKLMASTSSVSVVAAATTTKRKRKIFNSPDINSSTSTPRRKSPRLDEQRRPSPTSVVSESLRSTSLRPRVLFPSN